MADGADGSSASVASAPGGRPKTRQRFSKGRRPYFLKDPDVDRMLAIITALVAEVSVVRERLDTTERLAEQNLPATPANIEAYEPDAGVEAAREAQRSAMLGRVFRILALERDPENAEDTYAAMIEQFS